MSIKSVSVSIAIAAALVLPTAQALAAEFAFIECNETKIVDGVETMQTLKVNIVTNAAKKPVSIKGFYQFNTNGNGHGFADMLGAIKGRTYNGSTGYSTLVLSNGKFNINVEGDLQVEKLLSVAFAPSQTSAGYTSMAPGASPHFRDITSCTVKNLGLFNSIPKI